MKDPYEVLGIGRDATDEEVKSAYRTLAKKYHPDNYGPDNPLKDLAEEKMQEVNAAYDEIQKQRAEGQDGGYSSENQYSYGGDENRSSGVYAEIRRALNAKRFGEAERLLNTVAKDDRTPEWHFLNSLVLVRRGRMNDAMRELEIACNAEPDNLEYQKAKEMFNTKARGYGSTYYGDGPSRSGAGCDVCDICLTWMVCDCICDMLRCL